MSVMTDEDLNMCFRKAGYVAFPGLLLSVLGRNVDWFSKQLLIT